MGGFDLSGKVAVVTGGSSGIGLGYATGLAEAGADLCLWSIDEDGNRTAAEKLGAFGGRVETLYCDVTDEEQVNRSFEATVEAFDRVDACFANAGIAPKPTRFQDLELDEWRRLVSVHLEGVFLTLRAAYRHMMQHDGGSLVATSSYSALSGSPGSPHYAAAKAGVVALIKTLAVEGARFGIRANAVIPGWIDTGFGGGMMQSEAFETRILPRIPQRRWGSGADFSPLAVYLASDASHYHTGDSFVVDGGYRLF